MEDKIELLKHIHKDAEMAAYTIEELLKEIKEKDNKIKDAAEDILKQYQVFLKEAKELLKKQDASFDENGMMSKMGAKMGIMKEVDCDNSDSSIADMLIKGISMGSIDMEKKINDYTNNVDKETLKFAEKFAEFQKDAIEKLKKFL